MYTTIFLNDILSTSKSLKLNKKFVDNYIEKIKTKKIHIVGAFGAEGSAVLEFLAAHDVKNITAHDFSVDKEDLWKNFSKTHLWIKKKNERLEAFENLMKLPACLNLKNKYLEGIMEADLIFAPSSWSLYKPNFPALKDASEKGVEFSSITRLYFEMAKGKIISVTGTKGKGTTSRLIYDIIAGSSDKKAVYLAGNDRRAGQELDKISRMDKDDILVLETSNRQLMNGLGKSPNIGVITNISPDHIDEHGSFEKYIEVKKSLFKYSKKGDMAIMNYDNAITRDFGNLLIKRGIDVYFFSRRVVVERGVYLDKDKIYVNIKGKEYLCDIHEIKLIGEHNLENVLAASIAAYLAGIRMELIRNSIKKFIGLPHRIEFIGEYGKVRFYDDMASTNPESSVAALKAIEKIKKNGQESRIFLIIGGDNKGMNYEGLANEILSKVDILFLLPGTGTDVVKSKLLAAANIRIKVIECIDFLEVLNLIKKQTKTGDIVLISPAAAHFQTRYIDILKKPIKNLIVEKFR